MHIKIIFKRIQKDEKEIYAYCKYACFWYSLGRGKWTYISRWSVALYCGERHLVVRLILKEMIFNQLGKTWDPQVHKEIQKAHPNRQQCRKTIMFYVNICIVKTHEFIICFHANSSRFLKYMEKFFILYIFLSKSK